METDNFLSHVFDNHIFIKVEIKNLPGRSTFLKDGQIESTLMANGNLNSPFSFPISTG